MYKWITSWLYDDDCYAMLFDSEGMDPGLSEEMRFKKSACVTKYGYEELAEGIVYCLSEKEFLDFLHDHKYEAFIDSV